MITSQILGLLIQILGLSCLGGSVYLLVKEREKVPAGQSSDESWTIHYKILILIFSIFSPIITGAILYYGLRNKSPKKAKTANHLSFLGLIIFLVLWYFIGTYGPIM